MTGKAILVDTGAWYALADQSDQYNREAISTYRQILKDFQKLVITNLIVAESYTLIRKGLGHNAGIGFLKNLGASPRIIKFFSDLEMEGQAEDLIRRYKDQDFSYTDAVSFVCMERLNINQAFTFDRHFRTAGFEVLPGIK
jgi:predicted nucleic acid-binding protein